MTAALANHSQGETGMKRRRSGSLTPYSNFSPAFWPQWDLCSLDPSTLCWSISPPLASFPFLLSQDNMVHHSNLFLVSTFKFLDPLPAATYPCQPTTTDSSSNPFLLHLHQDCQAQLGRITQLYRLVSRQIYVFWSQLNSQHHFSTCPGSAPIHIPFKGPFPSCWWSYLTSWKKWGCQCQCVALLLLDQKWRWALWPADHRAKVE